jgi:hypothetical protein
MALLDIQMLGGKLYPRVWRMRKTGEENRYTQLTYKELKFKDRLPDNVFTLSSLRKARR